MSYQNAVTPRSCSGSIPIIPFRYAVMPKNPDDDTQYYYADRSNLDQSFGKLNTAAYSLRTLRPGYVYLYDEEHATIYLWEADGTGNYTALQWTSLEDYGRAANKSGTMQNITVCDDATTVWLAYSQDLWTKQAITKNINNKEKYMVKLDVAQILDGSGTDSTQQHVLPSGTPETWVEEYKTATTDYAAQFGWSCYQPEGVAPIENLKKKALDYAKMHQAKLPVFMALYDSVATVIDQGNIKKLYAHQLTDIKNQIENVAHREENAFNNTSSPHTTGFIDVPKAMQLDTTQLHGLSSEFYRKKTISDIIESILKSTYPTAEQYKKQMLSDLEPSMFDSAGIRLYKLHKQPQIQGMQVPSFKERTELAKKDLQDQEDNQGRTIGDREARFHVLTDTDINEEAEKILDFIDVDKLQTFNQEWASEQTNLNAIVEKVMLASEDQSTLLATMEEDQATHPRNAATQLASYDRDFIPSARALESCIASCIQGMGTPLAGKFTQDPCFKRLGEWVENPNSPLYLGLKAFKPFQDKIDSVADFMGNLGNIPADLFPDLPATHIIVKEVTVYSTYKIAISSITTSNTTTVIQNSRQVIQNVHNTVSIVGGGLDDLVKAIQGRYGILESQISNSSTTHTYIELLELETSPNISSARNTQTALIQSIQGTTSTVRVDNISMKKVIGNIGSAGLSAGASYLHILNLQSALKKFGQNDSLANSLNLGSAVFGTIAAFAESIIVSTTAFQAVRQRLVGVAAQKAIEKSILAKFSGPVQFVAAVFEASALGYEAFQLASRGDNDAAAWAGAAGLSFGLAGLVGASSAAVSSGLVASGSALGALALTGWGLVIVIGVLLIAGFIALWQKFKAEDRPLDVWVSRTIFGIPRTDIFGDEVDIPFENLAKALKDYYAISYSPVKLSDAAGKLSDQAETDWEEHWGSDDEAKFCFLLPGYVVGVSSLDYAMEGYDGGNVDSDADRKSDKVLERISQRQITVHEAKQTQEGVYVYLSASLKKYRTDSAGLKITYYPQGRDGEFIEKYLYVDD